MQMSVQYEKLYISILFGINGLMMRVSYIGFIA